MGQTRPPKKQKPAAGHVLHDALTPREARLLAAKPVQAKKQRPRKARRRG